MKKIKKLFRIQKYDSSANDQRVVKSWTAFFGRGEMYADNTRHLIQNTRSGDI